MLGVEGYGSGSDVESDNEAQITINSFHKPVATSTKRSTGLSLPPPSAGPSSKATSGPSLPPPKKKAPKKITIGLPSLYKASDDDVREEEEEEDRPPAKKPRLGAGAGSSSLFNMLPAPKNKAPVPPSQESVLGGGRGPGLVFRTPKPQPQRVTVEEVEDEDDENLPTNVAPLSSSILEEATETKSAIPFLPPSLVKGRANVSTEETHVTRKATVVAKPPTPAVDFFSLSSTSSSSKAIHNSTSSSSLPRLPTVSSAPKIEEYVPPEPTPQDPYPGYYILPSGSWAAYDSEYYKKFYNKWKKEYDDHVRALEKGFEGADEDATEVNALKEMEKARVEIQEREERKSLTTAANDAPAAPNMNIKGAALSGRARTRHQLSSLLTEAYQNREALEEKIAQGRRNRKEAGNKYGF